MLTIDIDDAIEARLRERAAASGRSPEEEAREVLGTVLLPPPAEDQQTAADAIFRQSFAGRVLPFDEAASRAYASIAATRRALGRPIDELDGQIAAIALDARFAVVTRNVTDFEQCGLTVVDPWTSVP